MVVFGRSVCHEKLGQTGHLLLAVRFNFLSVNLVIKLEI